MRPVIPTWSFIFSKGNLVFSALSAVKLVASTVVGVGTGKIVSGVIKSNIATPEKLIDKVAIVAATWTLSGVVTNVTKKYTNDMIDETYNGIVDYVKEIKRTAALRRINAGESTFEDEGLDQDDFFLDLASNHWVVKNPEGGDGMPEGEKLPKTAAN